MYYLYCVGMCTNEYVYDSISVYMHVFASMCLNLCVCAEDAIDQLRAKRVTVFLRDEENNLVATEIPLISPAIRAIVDNILFVSAYGHKVMWEARTRPAFRATVLAQIAKEAKDNADAFFDSWKDFRRRFPVQQEAAAEEDEFDEEMMEQFFGDAAPGPAAAPAEED